MGAYHIEMRVLKEVQLFVLAHFYFPWLTLLEPSRLIFCDIIKVMHDCENYVSCFQFPDFIASFFSRLSWPSRGSTVSAAPSRNVPRNIPSHTGRRVEASIFSVGLCNMLKFIFTHTHTHTRAYMYIK